MDLYQSFILGTIQGLTEFIPVSSSGHLALLPSLLDWTEQSTTFDIILHGGTLLALIIYFRKKLITMFLLARKGDKKEIDVIKKLIFVTIPAGSVGLFIDLINKTTDDSLEQVIKNDYIMIANLILGGLLFFWVDYSFRNNNKTVKDLSIKNLIVISLFQCLALIRGTSRSGIIIVGAMSQKMTKESAAEFSFLMGIPIIGLSFGYKLLEFILDPKTDVGLSNIIIGFVTSFIFGLIAIKFMLSFLKSKGLSYFGFYRIILALIALVLIRSN